MGSWTANRLRAMLCGRLSIDEINIISEKHGGPDTMFAMVRSLDEEQAKIFLYNILNEGLSARLSAFAETVNVSENDLQQVIDHYGGPSNLCDVLDFYSWPTLTFFTTMLKYREECPVKLLPKATPGTGDCMIYGLIDGALHNPQLQDSKKKLLEALECKPENVLPNGTWNTSQYRRKSCHFGMQLYSGHCSKPAESCKFNHSVNIKPADMSNTDWKKYWVELMKPGVFDLPSNLGPLAGDISDSTLPLAAFYLRKHIIVFHGEQNLIQLVDGNFFKRGNVEDFVPLILGKSRNHYQTLVPDDDSDDQAYQKIRDFVSDKSFENARNLAIELSIRQKSASDDDDSRHGSGNTNKTPFIDENSHHGSGYTNKPFLLKNTN